MLIINYIIENNKLLQSKEKLFPYFAKPYFFGLLVSSQFLVALVELELGFEFALTFTSQSLFLILVPFILASGLCKLSMRLAGSAGVAGTAGSAGVVTVAFPDVVAFTPGAVTLAPPVAFKSTARVGNVYKLPDKNKANIDKAGLVDFMCYSYTNY